MTYLEQLTEQFELYRSYYLSIAGNVMKNGDVEDLVSEAFLRAVKSIHQFRGDTCTIRTWIVTILRNVCFEKGRPLIGRFPIPLDGHDVVDISPGVDTVLDDQRRHQRMMVAMESLRPTEKDTLMFVLQTGKNIPTPSFKSRKRRGVIKLKQILAGKGCVGEARLE